MVLNRKVQHRSLNSRGMNYAMTIQIHGPCLGLQAGPIPSDKAMTIECGLLTGPAGIRLCPIESDNRSLYTAPNHRQRERLQLLTKI